MRNPTTATVSSRHDAPDRSLTSFDAIRLGAAFAVLVSHHFLLAGRSEPRVGAFGSVGFFSVGVFFVISGYFVAASWARDGNLVRYGVRRAVRIFPALIVLVVITTLVIGPVVTDLALADYAARPSTWTYAKDAVLAFGIQYDLPGVFTSGAVSDVNLSLWSLPVELAMYAVLACVGFVVPRSARWAYAVAASLFAVAWWVTPEADGFAMTQGLSLGVLFFAGASIHAFRLDRHLSNRVIGACLGAVTLAAVIGGDAANAVLWLALPVVVIGLGLRESRIGSLVARKGDISYGVYLWAFPLQQIALRWAGVGFVSSMVIAAAATTALAVLSLRFVERPALGMRPARV